MIRESFTMEMGLQQGLENRETGKRETTNTMNKWGMKGITFKTFDIVRKLSPSPVFPSMWKQLHSFSDFSQGFYSLCLRELCKGCSLASRCHSFISISHSI